MRHVKKQPSVYARREFGALGLQPLLLRRVTGTFHECAHGIDLRFVTLLYTTPTPETVSKSKDSSQEVSLSIGVLVG